MVGVRLGLIARGHQLSGVRLERGLVRRRQRRQPSLVGRHRDLLRRELVVDLVRDEHIRPDQQATRDEQDDREKQAANRDESVKSRAHTHHPGGECRQVDLLA